MQEREKGIDYRDFSLEEILELGRRSAQGDLNAREKLILSHLNLVKGLIPEFSGRGAEADDLYQEGCYGLILAVDKYDYSRGTRFSTYAISWIRKRMQKAVARQNLNIPFGIDSETYQLLCRYRQYLYTYQEAHDRQPEKKELATALGVSIRTISELQHFLYTFLSLDAPVHENQDSPLCDIGSPQIHHVISSTEDEVITRLAGRDLSEVELPIQNVPLTKREREALRRRLGFTPSGEPETWSSIAEAMGCGKSTVHRAYLSAVQKLRDAINERK